MACPKRARIPSLRAIWTADGLLEGECRRARRKEGRLGSMYVSMQVCRSVLMSFVCCEICMVVDDRMSCASDLGARDRVSTVNVKKEERGEWMR
jgi:hypothetical protein